MTSSLKQEYERFSLYRVENFKQPLSLTMTFIGSAKKAQLEAHERFTTLLHKLSKITNRNAYKRRKELIQCVAVTEHDDQTRAHIHAIFDVPVDYSEEDFLKILKPIAENLFDLRQSYITKTQLRKKPIIHVSKLNSPKKAIGYIMKTKTKDNSMNFAEFVIA